MQHRFHVLSTDDVYSQITSLTTAVTQILNVICLSSLDLGDRKSPGTEKFFMQGKKVKMQKCRPCHTFRKEISLSLTYLINTIATWTKKICCNQFLTFWKQRFELPETPQRPIFWLCQRGTCKLQVYLSPQNLPTPVPSMIYPLRHFSPTPDKEKGYISRFQVS
jgi:hypothetical protein